VIRCDVKHHLLIADIPCWHLFSWLMALGIAMVNG